MKRTILAVSAVPAQLLVDTQWMLTDADNLQTCVLASETRPSPAERTLLGTRARRASGSS